MKTTSSSNARRLSGFWANLSLARKLLIAFSALALLALVVGVVANTGLRRVQTSYDSALDGGGAIELNTLHMSIDLLTARRHEKDFLARWTDEGFDAAYANYVVTNKEAVAEIHEHIDELAALAPVVEQEKGSAARAKYESDLATLSESIDLYQQNFLNTVQLLQEKGFKDTGLEGQFRTDVHNIEDRIIGREDLQPLVITMLTIRRHEKDYLLRGDLTYIDQTRQSVADLKQQIAASDVLGSSEKRELTKLADQYLASFDALVQKDVEIATSIQAFRDAARAMEPVADKLVVAGNELSAADVATAQSNSTQTLLYSSITMVVALLFALFLSVALSRQITRPVTLLTVAAHELEIGNYDVHSDVISGDELGTLASAFNAMAIRLKEAFALITKRAKELQSVAEIATQVSQNVSANEMLQSVVELTKSSYSLYHAHVYLFDDSKDKLVLTAGAGEVGSQMVSEKRSIPADHPRSLVARAARTAQGAISNDVTKEPDFLPNPLLPDTRSEMAVPILIGDNVFGVLDVQADYVNRFTNEDIAIITTLSRQIAVSLQNIRQYEQTIATTAELAGFQGAINSAAIVSVANVKGEIEYVNDNFARISKYSREELLGQDHRIVNSSYLPKEEIRNLWVTIANGRIWHGEFRNKAKDGSYYWVDTYISPVLNERGKPVKYIGVRFDITERKQAEEALAKRAQQQEALNLITQKIQGATTIEAALQMTARELGRALGNKQTLVALDRPNDHATVTEEK